MPVATRAQILGHSIEVNNKYYTFPDRTYLEDATEQIATFKASKSDEVTQGQPNIIDFSKIKKTQKPNVSKPFTKFV